jgi:DNA primase
MRKSVDYDTFLAWVQEKFTDIKVTDEKIRINSIYCDHLGGDEKHHLWCRPHTGYYHCYKSGKKGTLLELVMDIDKCSHDAAVDTLGGQYDLLDLEEKLAEFLSGTPIEKINEKPTLKLPEGSISVNKLLPPFQAKVLAYLQSRKIPTNGLYYCISGEFSGRIVIPYYNSDGELIYFNARDIVKAKSLLRYRGPESSSGFKKEEAVWMSFFPRKGAKIHLTEGEFDAMTLNECGFHGCATGGKDVSEKQIALIRDYDICIAFDRDKSGKEALGKLGWSLFENGVKRVSFVRPPDPYKDWNEMFTGGKEKIALSDKIIRAYIIKNEKPFNEFTAALLSI